MATTQRKAKASLTGGGRIKVATPRSDPRPVTEAIDEGPDLDLNVNGGDPIPEPDYDEPDGYPEPEQP